VFRLERPDDVQQDDVENTPEVEFPQYARFRASHHSPARSENRWEGLIEGVVYLVVADVVVFVVVAERIGERVQPGIER